MIRLGLCCIFREAPIRFRRTTAAAMAKLKPAERRQRLADICRHNAESLADALAYCRAAGIGAFRINSQILPLITHPQQGYGIEDLPGHRAIIDRFRQCGEFARRHDIRTSFHPDPFVVIASPRADVGRKSVAELVYQAMVAEWVNADVINIHAGGVYGDKPASLGRLAAAIDALPTAVRSRLTLENDDRSYSPADLLPVCRRTGVPLTYDVHHHRCLPDGMDTAEATTAALTTWRREPLFHLSSPLERSGDRVDRRHHEFIQIEDLPSAWLALPITVDVEAKAKEMAVLRLQKELVHRSDQFSAASQAV
jgi:UV DNA damage endonuclease